MCVLFYLCILFYIFIYAYFKSFIKNKNSRIKTVADVVFEPGSVVYMATPIDVVVLKCRKIFPKGNR